MDIKIPIFCINVETSTKRKESIQKNLIEDLGFDIEFWKATSKDDPIISSIDTDAPYLKRELKTGEIALAISYSKLLKHIIDSNLNEAIIIEDDILPNPILPLIKNTNNISALLFDYIRLCKKEFPDMELLQLHKHLYHNSFPIIEEYDYCYKPNYGFWGTPSNYFTQEGARSMYEAIKDYKLVVDHYWKMPLLKNKIGISKMSFFIHCHQCSKYFPSEIK